MKDAHDVILRPVVSEKSYGLFEQKVYTFVVPRSASKPEIRDAVERIWPNVKVKNVNTLNRKGKTKRDRKKGTDVKLPDHKHAIVTLTAESAEIEIFQAG